MIKWFSKHQNSLCHSLKIHVPYMHAHTVVNIYVCTLYRLGRECGFKEENEIAVAIKYAKEQG